MSSDPNGALPPGIGARSGNNDSENGACDGVPAEPESILSSITNDKKQEIRSAEKAAAESRGVVPLEITSLISGETVPIYGTMTGLSDNWSSNFNEETVYGRIDPIPTFSNTTRTISVSIDLVPITANAQTMANSAKNNQIVISDIAKMCYPGYQTMNSGEVNFNAAVLKSAPLVEIKHGNVICGHDGGPLKAYIKSFGTTVQTDGLYALAGATSATSANIDIYYHRLSISLEFGILHDSDMGYNESGAPKAQFGSYPYFFGDE